VFTELSIVAVVSGAGRNSQRQGRSFEIPKWRSASDFAAIGCVFAQHECLLSAARWPAVRELSECRQQLHFFSEFQTPQAQANAPAKRFWAIAKTKTPAIARR
jgi:hypothetical protein